MAPGASGGRTAVPSSAVKLVVLAAAGCAIVLALIGCSESSGTSGAAARKPGAYTLMQMNLCLSGMAGCYAKVAYPAGVEDAISRIREARPDAVTLNETCRRDAETIGRRTGYHLRFTRVIYAGELLPCVRPGGRGLFGDAVLTKAAITRTENHDFEGQSGPERRRWICVTTRVGVDVCTAHLNTQSAVEARGNGAQCTELTALLARRAAARTVIFGGDVNRRSSCAPDGLWTRTDSAADQAAGIQHVYGSSALRSPVAELVEARHSDHDVLVVHAQLTPRR